MSVLSTFTPTAILGDVQTVAGYIWPLMLGGVAVVLGFKLGPYAKRLLGRR